MTFPVVLERVPEAEGLPNFYYATVPGLGLTTHGEGPEGALEAIRDLLGLWLAELRARGEEVAPTAPALVTTVDVA